MIGSTWGRMPWGTSISRGPPAATMPGARIQPGSCSGLRLGLKLRPRGTDLSQATLSVAHPGPHLAAVPLSAESGILLDIGPLGLRQPALDLCRQFGLCLSRENGREIELLRHDLAGQMRRMLLGHELLH